MITHTVARAGQASSQLARRQFSTSLRRLESPHHYPEGPRSNLPFNPLTRFFAFRYWAFMATGFGIPFGVAFWQTYKNH